MLAIFCDDGYSSEFFEETTNVRSFGQASLWANIGGYIGMLLGLSLLQVPDIISGIFMCIQRKRICPKCRRNFETSTDGTGTGGNQD